MIFRWLSFNLIIYIPINLYLYVTTDCWSSISYSHPLHHALDWGSLPRFAQGTPEKPSNV